MCHFFYGWVWALLCWISCVCTPGRAARHISLFCASYGNTSTRESDRSPRKSGADVSWSKVFACWDWECVALSLSNFLPCASGPEFCLGLQLYENGYSKGVFALSLTRLNLPNLLLKLGARRLRRPSLCTYWLLVFEFDVSPIVYTNRQKWMANIYAAWCWRWTPAGMAGF